MGRTKADEIETPTDAQLSTGAFAVEDIVDRHRDGRSMVIGKAYRRRRMVDILGTQGLFGDAEFKALKHYAHHADTADNSPIRDSLRRYMPGGCGGDGPSVELVNAMMVTSACEKAAGSLAPILRAVIVNDCSLSEWAIRQSGSIEVCRMRKGKRVCVYEPHKRALADAVQDIKMAAIRVRSEIEA